MLPKRGRSLPPGSGGGGHPRSYPEIVSLALRSELDDTGRRIKTVQRWTGASERTVKNWLSASAGPSGDHLIAMLIHSDTMLQMILIASKRPQLAQILSERPRDGAVHSQRELLQDTNDRRHPRPLHDPDRVPDSDPAHDPDRTFVPNERQSWFLTELASGKRVSSRSLQDHFGVAEKTAKRDIASLKANGRVCFVGTRRRGRYKLVPSRHR
jgi:hypothetical protein